ncbi:mucin-associated surface protein (MASP) [Trypanosoma cruzi]|nr:mucin-associated surface protein (MASP) [Trypanosoma cruzi]
MVTRDAWLQGVSAVVFFLTGGVEELQVLADAIAGVRACVSATRSAAVGKTCFTLAVEAGINEANVWAHHPTLCTVLPRRLDLIASHIEPSPCGRNVVSKRSRGRRARHLHSSVEVSRGRNADLSASGISLPFDAIFGESVGTVWCSCLLLDDWSC